MNTLEKLYHLDTYLPKNLVRLGEAKYLNGKTLQDVAPILKNNKANRCPSTFVNLFFCCIPTAITCVVVTYFSGKLIFGIAASMIVGCAVAFVIVRRFNRYNETRLAVEEAEAQVVRLYDALEPFDVPQRKRSLEIQFQEYTHAVILKRTELQAMRGNLHYDPDTLAAKCEEWKKAKKELEDYRQKLTEWELIRELDQDQILRDAEWQVKFDRGELRLGQNQKVQNVV